MGRRPIVIGVTGGIGAGKSTAVEAFVRRGAVPFEADAVVHGLYATSEVADALQGRWGDRVRAVDGSIDRAAVANIVFRDASELAWLEGVVHPLVAREWTRFLDDLASRPDAPEFVVSEVPLLFEAGLQDRFDEVVLVTAPLETRIERVGNRASGGSHVRERAARQLPEQVKQSRADRTWHNVGSPDDLQVTVDDLLAELRTRTAT